WSQRQRAAQLLDTGPHRRDADTVAGRSRGVRTRLDAPAVVLHRELDPPLAAPEPDDDAAGAGVPARVGQGLGRHAVHGDLARRRSASRASASRSREARSSSDSATAATAVASGGQRSRTNRSSAREKTSPGERASTSRRPTSASPERSGTTRAARPSGSPASTA